jgi:hypothetical protein
MMRVATAAAAALAFSSVAQAQVTVNGGRINEPFDYTAGAFPAPLAGLGGVPGSPSHPNLAIENWNTTGDTTNPGDPFILRGSDLPFGEQVALFPTALQRSIGRNPQAGVGEANRDFGNGINTNTEKNILNNFKESWTKIDFQWNGGKAAFGMTAGTSTLSGDFDVDNAGGNPRLLAGDFGYGFNIDSTGLLKAATWQFTGIEEDDPTGIQLLSGDTYRAYMRVKTTNAGEDEVDIYVVDSSAVTAATTTYLFDDAAVSSTARDINNFNMSNQNPQLALFASQNLIADSITVGWLNGTTSGNFAETGLRDAARQELIADRSPHTRIAWKASLGDPYVTGDNRLDGVLDSIDIDNLREQIGNGNTNAFYDLNTDLTVDTGDVDFLVQNIFATDYGDVDLDGVIDAADEAVVQGNQGLFPGGGADWGDGDMTGDGLVDALDLAFFNPPLQGDLDGDGFVGIADLNIVLGNWNRTVPPGDPAADPSGDDFVGIEDLNAVLGNWNAGTPPAAAVPEPATLALLSVGGVVALRRR